MAAKTLDLETTLDLIRKYRVFLCYDDLRSVDLWTPHTRQLPLALRRSVVKHRVQIEQLMLIGASSVCPNPKLHKVRWNAKVCRVCQRLEPSMSEERQQVA